MTATDVSQLLTRTAPHATTLHIQAEGLHIISDGAFHLNTVGEPAVITVDFVIRQHRSLIFQDSDDRTFELPAFTPPPQRLPSDGFFERDAAHLLSALSTHPGVTSEKALASFANKQLMIRGRCGVMYRAAPSFI